MIKALFKDEMGTHHNALTRLVTSLSCASVLTLLALNSAYALDTNKSASAMAAVNQMANVTPQQALREGARAYYSGEKDKALSPLRYAAENGQAMAAWKLGRMYAEGDGVPEDDLQAFQYFSQVVREYSSDGPKARSAPFVASALVELGRYFLTGIGDSPVKQNTHKAREVFTYAASYFGDADAQYNLGIMYLNDKLPDYDRRLAARWLKLAAVKGHVGAQAKFGELLYFTEELTTARMTGLKWMTLARRQVVGGDNDAWIVSLHEKAFSLASEKERRNSAEWADAWLVKRGHVIASSN
ncbi:Sel1 repeat protein [Pseudovibrio sp. Ad5]|uniref:tetratricopeptide repeat protein n=1 Tax=Pseudovibrio sp. Ad5 TaxID=989436 RepID=UPI0007B25764|nr:tetratricopeptide repeat protein [Pseudovibrio sp. Ad5]KZK97892.1 Sel1 repeat protein [Pseudovibrio sp. Ad5]